MKLNPRLIAYWVTTALTAYVFLAGGAMYLVRPAFLLEAWARIGYPLYVITILGIWKLLGGVAVLIPGTPRLKEWAYAGMLFNLTGASASHAAVGDAPVEIATPIVILCIVIASWALRPESRRLSGPAI